MGMATMGPRASLMGMLHTMLARVAKAMLLTMHHHPLHMAMHQMGNGHMAMDHFTTSPRTGAGKSLVMDQCMEILLPLMVARGEVRQASQPMVAASHQIAGAKGKGRISTMPYSKTGSKSFEKEVPFVTILTALHHRSDPRSNSKVLDTLPPGDFVERRPADQDRSNLHQLQYL